jgi:hypothetical protein
MRTHQNESRIALQPENEVEQSLLSELFTRLNNVSEAPEHPTKVGSRLCFYTLDIPMYDDLDQDLWEEAECDVNEHGRLDPEPGSRALVVVYNQGANEASQEDVDKAVQAVEESPAGEDNEYAIDRDELLERVEDLVEQDDPEYSELQEAAKDASSMGFDIPANQRTEELVRELETFAEAVREAGEA